MDFAKLMSAQISKTSTPPTASSSNKTPTNATQPQAYQKRAEAEAVREAAYRAEQAALESERIAKAEKKRQREEEDVEREREREVKRRRLKEESRARQREDDEAADRKRRKRLGLPELPEPSQNGAGNGAADGSAAKEGTSSGEDAEDMPEAELHTKLRELNEPAVLFGEDHPQRLKRYQRILQKAQSSTKQTQAVTNRDQPIPTSLEPLPEADILVPTKLPSTTDTAARLYLARQLSTWFNLVLREWALALAGRDSSVKTTFAGQAASTSYTQALAHLKPMFRKLEKLSTDTSILPADLLNPTCEIVRAAQERRYVDANDGYLQLSIGKAAWPIGVTMVGIHERSAREKLGESEKGKAHIMSDEATRKMLQSIKRCLSFAQTRWPPEDGGQLMG